MVLRVLDQSAILSSTPELLNQNYLKFGQITDNNYIISGYEQPGKMILAQGAELLHHVTPVTNNIIRISLIFGYAPANAFQPPKTILKTFQKVDQTLKMANYEFFREKAWQTMHCLKHYVRTHHMFFRILREQKKITKLSFLLIYYSKWIFH